MRRIMSCAAFLACAACQQTITAPAQVDTAAEIKAIEALEKSQMTAVDARDPAGASGVYADDAVFINEAGKVSRGRETIAGGFKAMLADPSVKLTYTPGPKTISATGDMAYAAADYTMSFTDPKTKKPVTVKGTNLSVWRKQADGSWKLAADSNPGAPAG